MPNPGLTLDLFGWLGRHEMWLVMGGIALFWIIGGWMVTHPPEDEGDKPLKKRR